MSNCTYTFQGRKYTEQEFKEYIVNNGEYMVTMQDATLYRSEDGGITLNDTGVPLNNALSGMSRESSPNQISRTRVQPAGVFISGSFIAKYIPNYRQYKPEELFGTFDEEGNLIKQGLIDNKILTSLIGYRIPNQGAASNDALQIVGILPEENGDTIVAYTGVTTKTGSD